jgi:autotransporter-associated beta strand protein
VLTFDSHASLIHQSSDPPLIPNSLPPGASAPSNNPGGLALEFFTNANSGYAAIYVTGTVTLESIVFANTGAANYQLLGDGVATHGINLNNDGIGASINVNSGFQFVSVPITLADSGGTTFYVGPGANLFLTNIIGESGRSRSLNIAGEGAMSLSSVNTYTGGTTMSNGVMVFDGAGRPSSHCTGHDDYCGSTVRPCSWRRRLA